MGRDFYSKNSKENCGKNCADMRGSYSLGAILSITLGLVFFLGVVNITRYIHAVNVVEQAARSTARCLTPTDPACFAFLPSGVFNGIIDNGAGETYSTEAREYWTLSLQGPQQPARRISPILNDKQLVYAYVDITAEKEEKELLANYNADLFVPNNNGNRIVKDVTVSARDWRERLNTVDSIQSAVAYINNSARATNNNSVHIESSDISVPHLSEEIQSVTPESDAVDNPILAYKLSQQENKNALAYVAFRVFLTPLSARGNLSIYTEDTPGINLSTFRVETFNSDGVLFRTNYLELTPLTVNVRYAGTSPSGDYLPGGSSDAPFHPTVIVSPRAVGMFGVVAVPRGGSFRIATDLTRSVAGLNAEILYQIEDYNLNVHYADDTCTTKTFVVANGTPDCANYGFSSCRFSPEYSYKSCSETNTPRETVAVCSEAEIPGVNPEYVWNVNNSGNAQMTTVQCLSEPLNAAVFARKLPEDVRVCDFNIASCEAEGSTTCPLCEGKALNLALTRSYKANSSAPALEDFNIQMLKDIYDISQEELSNLPYEIYFNRLEIVSNTNRGGGSDSASRTGGGTGSQQSGQQGGSSEHLKVKTFTEDVADGAWFEKATELAKQRGYAEIARTFGGPYDDCAGRANCSQVSVTHDGPNAVVDVSYNLPLTFPFNTLVKDFVVVSTRKEEAMELFTR